MIYQQFSTWEKCAWRALTDALNQRYFFLHPGNGYGRLTFVMHRVLIYSKLWQQLVPVAVASACLNSPFLRIITSFIVICFTAFNNWEVEVVNDANSDDSQFKCEICACWFWHLHRLTLKQYGLSVLPALQIWRIIRWKIYQISVSRQNLKMYRKLFYHSHHFFY